MPNPYPTDHPDAENHAYCADCGGEYRLSRSGDDWIYDCFACGKALTPAQYRAEQTHLQDEDPHADQRGANWHVDDQIAEAFFNADEPLSSWEKRNV